MRSVLREHLVDGLLALMLACRADPRRGKLDLGIGIYRDETGDTPVMAAVKAAEPVLVEEQGTKTYVGVDGDIGFVDRLAAIPFDAQRAADPRLAGMQTPGGIGALAERGGAACIPAKINRKVPIPHDRCSIAGVIASRTCLPA